MSFLLAYKVIEALQLLLATVRHYVHAVKAAVILTGQQNAQIVLATVGNCNIGCNTNILL